MISSGHSPECWLQVLSHLDPAYGGLSAVVPRLAGQLAAQEDIQTGIAAFCTPDERHLAAQSSLNVSAWPLNRSEWLWDGSLREQFRATVAGSTGVHIHGVWESSTLMAASAARSLEIPYVLSAHGMLERWALANKKLKKQIYAALFEHRNTRGAACLHALTRAEADDYRRFGCKGSVAVIPNGVEAQPDATPDLFLAQYPAAAGKRLVLFLGRIHYKKGVDLLLRSWAENAARHPETLLVFAGPDSENTLVAAQRTVDALKLHDRVLFTGMLNTTLKWSALSAASFYCLPSYSEGLSVATLEALSMGVPVIISEQCNLPEVAASGAGWQVQTAVKPLAAALHDALSCDSATYQRYSRCAEQLAANAFSWTSVVERMAELYRWVRNGTEPRHLELLRSAA